MSGARVRDILVPVLRDTTKEAAQAQVEAWRRLGPAKTAEMALSFSDEIRAQRLELLKRKRPSLSDAACVRLLIRELHGLDV